MANGLPFDSVQIQNDDNTTSFLSPDQFLAVPLPTRLRWILEHRIEFFLAGTPVPSREALQELRRQRAAAAA